MPPGARRLERWAALLALAAATLHALAAPAHLEEWWVYGVLFLFAAAVQAMLGLVLWTQGIEGWGGWPRVRRAVYAFGMLLSVALLAVWAVSRTAGLPIGPEAYEPESVGVADAATKLVEAALLLVLARLWWTARPGAGKPGAGAG